jgi:hypothetical protein
MLVLMLMASNAFAQKPYTISPAGPVIIRTADGKDKTEFVTVTNETGNPLTIHVTYRGDTSLQFLYGQWSSFTIGADSAAGFPMRYRPSRGDTSVGYLHITDSMYAPDSVMFIGIDTTSTPTWGVNTQALVMGSYYQAPDSSSLTLYNYSSNEITIDMTMSGSNGIELVGSGSLTIAASSSSSVVFRYLSHLYNSADATVRLTQSGRAQDVKLYGRKMLPPRDSLYWQLEQSFNNVQAGDTVCRTVYIVNPFDSSAMVTSFTLPQNSPFYISNSPALPLVLGSHDTLQITLCYIAPNSGNQTTSSYISMEYEFGGDSARSQLVFLSGSTAPCFEISPSYLAFNVLRDSVEIGAVSIANRSNSTITLDADFDQAGGGHFEVLTSMPITIGVNDTATVYIKFTATGASAQYAKLIFDGGTGCGMEDLALAARIIDTNIVIDSNAIGLFGDETRELDFVGDSNFTSVTYRFYNDQADTIKVTSISMKDGTHFSVTDVAPHMPTFKLAQNALMEVTIQFDGTPGTYTDTLVIVTENNIITLSFPLNAVISSSDVLSSTVGGPQLMVSPNPSTGPVAISIANAQTATIEVLDIMGTRLVQLNGVHASLDRTNMTAGTYFVRASGIGDNGKPFVITQRIVLQ